MLTRPYIMFARCKNLYVFILCVSMAFTLSSWRFSKYEESWEWIQRCLLQSYNQLSETSLKKWDLSVSPEGFFRLKKVFPSGKQEYFSFNISRLKEINFRGSSDSGEIIFVTREDDIIVQTYNDPHGNIDSMSTVFKLPVLGMEPQKLDSLRNALLMFKH